MSEPQVPPDDSLAAARTWGIAWSGMTHVGKVRKNNEDTFLALTSDGRQVSFLGKLGDARSANSDFVFAVSDGMGGARSGEFASRIAVDKITKLIAPGLPADGRRPEQRLP